MLKAKQPWGTARLTHASAAQSFTKCGPITCPWAWKGRRGNLGLLQNSADSSRRQTSSRRWRLEGNKLRAKSRCQRTFIFASYSKFAPTSAASSVFSDDQKPHSVPTCSYSLPPVYRGANSICGAFVSLWLALFSLLRLAVYPPQW